jgi:dTDP-glucose 4,6-dehydratase
MINVQFIQTLGTTIDTALATNPSLAQQYPDALCVSGCKCEDLIVFVADRPGHYMPYSIDEAKARAELGFIPSKSFEEGLAGTVQWYLDNQSWWGPNLDGSCLKQRGVA